MDVILTKDTKCPRGRISSPVHAQECNRNFIAFTLSFRRSETIGEISLPVHVREHNRNCLSESGMSFRAQPRNPLLRPKDANILHSEFCILHLAKPLSPCPFMVGNAIGTVYCLDVILSGMNEMNAVEESDM